MVIAPYPAGRFRRTRRTEALRRLVRESTLSVDDLIWPVFVREGMDDETPIPAMPGVTRLTVDRLVKSAREGRERGHSGNLPVSVRRRFFEDRTV